MSAQATETTTTETAQPAGLVVRFEQTVKVTHDINVDTVFARLSEHEREEYFKVDLKEFGFTAEHERPMAYLTALADVDATSVLGSYAGVREDVTNDFDESARVTSRDGARVAFANREWSQADFDALAATVTWIKPPIPWEDMTEDQRQDALRTPGPADVPLAIDWSGLTAL